MTSFKRSIISSAIFLGALQTSGGVIASAASEQADQIQQRQLQEFLQDRKDMIKSEKLAGQKIDLFASPVRKYSGQEVLRFISSVSIQGGDHLNSSVRASIDYEFTGRFLGINDIGAILDRITQSYLKAGNVTSKAYLSAQDPKSNTLKIEIIEGTVSTLRADEHSQKLPLFNAFPFAEGRILNLRDLEQGLDQLNRLESNNARLEIKPGGSIGQSAVIVHNEERKPFRASITVDNEGPSNTGKDRAAVHVSYDNFLGFGDFIGYTHRDSIFDNMKHTTSSDAVNFTIPAGYNTFSFDAGSSRYYDDLELEDGTKHLLSGELTTYRTGWNRVVSRSESHKWAYDLGLSTTSPKNSLAYRPIDVSSVPLSVIETKLNYLGAVLDGTVSAGLGYSKGLSELGGSSDPSVLTSESPHAQFEKVSLDASVHMPLHILQKEISYDGQLVYQSSGTGLYGSQKILIGSLYSVRGFTNSSVSGDTGYFLRNEISVPADFGNGSFNGKVYAGLDTGTVANRDPNLPSGSLTGAAIGMRLQKENLSVNALISTPVSTASSISIEPAQISVSLSAKF